MEPFLYLLIALLFYFIFFVITHDIVNPAGVFLLVWFLTCAFSSTYISDLQQRWSSVMHFCLVGSGVAFFLGALIFYPRKRMQIIEKTPTTNTFRIISRVLFIFSFLCFFIEWWKNGFAVSLLAQDALTGDAKSVNQGVPFLHYGTLLLPMCTVLAFYELICDGVKLYLIVAIFVGVVFYSFGIGLSRGDIFMYVGSILFIISRYRRITFKSIIKVSLILFGIGVGGMLIRVTNTDSAVYTTTDSPIVSIFYSYIALNFENLQQLIHADLDYRLAGNASLRPLWTIVGQKEQFPVVEFTTLDVFNAKTYLYPFYHDYKLWGVLIFPFLIGLGIGFVYRVVTVSKNKYYIIVMALLQKSIFFAFFGNYFFGELVVMWPYLVGIVIAALSNKRLLLTIRKPLPGVSA